MCLGMYLIKSGLIQFARVYSGVVSKFGLKMEKARLNIVIGNHIQKRMKPEPKLHISTIHPPGERMI